MRQLEEKDENPVFHLCIDIRWANSPFALSGLEATAKKKKKKKKEQPTTRCKYTTSNNNNNNIAPVLCAMHIESDLFNAADKVQSGRRKKKTKYKPTTMNRKELAIHWLLPSLPARAQLALHYRPIRLQYMHRENKNEKNKPSRKYIGIVFTFWYGQGLRMSRMEKRRSKQQDAVRSIVCVCVNASAVGGASVLSPYSFNTRSGRFENKLTFV